LSVWAQNLAVDDAYGGCGIQRHLRTLQKTDICQFRL